MSIKLTNTANTHTCLTTLILKRHDIIYRLDSYTLENVWWGSTGFLTSEVILQRCLLLENGTFTNVLPQRNAMPQTQDMTPYPLTVYKYGPDMLCYPLIVTSH